MDSTASPKQLERGRAPLMSLKILIGGYYKESSTNHFVLSMFLAVFNLTGLFPSLVARPSFSIFTPKYICKLLYITSESAIGAQVIEDRVSGQALAGLNIQHELERYLQKNVLLESNQLLILEMNSELYLYTRNDTGEMEQKKWNRRSGTRISGTGRVFAQ